MSFAYSTDVGYGIRVKSHDGEGSRPAGHVVEVHFYEKSEAVKYAVQLIRAAQQRPTTDAAGMFSPDGYNDR